MADVFTPWVRIKCEDDYCDKSWRYINLSQITCWEEEGGRITIYTNDIDLDLNKNWSAKFKKIWEKAIRDGFICLLDYKE